MRRIKTMMFASDFETTVYSGQTSTEVWAGALAELNTKNEAIVLGSIEDFFNYLNRLNCNIILYFHNLKFDGSFILNYLFKENYTQAIIEHSSDKYLVEITKPEDMQPKSFNYVISDEGQWYKITIKLFTGRTIEIRDSLKLMPFALRTIGKAFHTEHQKLDMEYKGYRKANCYITPEEMEYIKNDVYVLREALEFMFSMNETKLTIGSCCLEEFKESKSKAVFKSFFPFLDTIETEDNTYNTLDTSYGSKTYDQYIRKSYRGGWCYLAKGKENKKFNQLNYDTTTKTNICGTTADVNSLYPSMMHSQSGNYYPVGRPTFWKGEIPKFLLTNEAKTQTYYFVRIKTRFKLKQGYLPTIQIKGTPYYKGNKMLETSDYIDKNGNTITFGKFQDENGNDYCGRLRPVMTLTQTDYELIKEHYDLYDTEILDGCYFKAEKGIFDQYINKWKEVKMNSKGAMRTLAKLFLNNLYGKFATSDIGDFKVAYMENGVLRFRNVQDVKKKTIYIPIGSAITSYARNFTIRAAQMNYHGVNQRGFIYADTDSIHCDLLPSEIKGIKVDDKEFCCWKLESCWNEAIFVRQKTYIEHVTHADLEPLENPYYDIKCAGMNDVCKKQFVYSLTQDIPNEWYEKATQEMIDFVEEPRTLEDFAVGLTIYGKLRPKQIKGGVILEETTFELREHSIF